MNALEKLRYAVTTLPGVLALVSEDDSAVRPSPERWAKKEVLGHLIDSASNNHQRFVRAQIIPRLELQGYDQEAWVRIQRYREAHWHDLIALWRTLNTHLIHIISKMPESTRLVKCRVAGGEEMTLIALFDDYVDHLEHHLRKMLGEWPMHGEARHGESEH